MKHSFKATISLIGVAMLLGGAGGDPGCTDHTTTAVETEQRGQNLQMEQFLRNQPVPSFDWSLERHLMIQIYIARQKATNTFSYVQSDYTGKVLWSCPSIGFPIPYSTQLTNPQQLAVRYLAGSRYVDGVVAQQEPNGLFTPATSEATWVPCVDEKGKITPVYEEKKVTVFFRPMEEVNGTLRPVAGTVPSMSIDPARR